MKLREHLTCQLSSGARREISNPNLKHTSTLSSDCLSDDCSFFVASDCILILLLCFFSLIHASLNRDSLGRILYLSEVDLYLIDGITNIKRMVESHLQTLIRIIDVVLLQFNRSCSLSEHFNIDCRWNQRQSLFGFIIDQKNWSLFKIFFFNLLILRNIRVI